MNQNINIEVTYALPEQQTVLQLTAPSGTTLAQAIDLSGILAQFPEIDLGRHKVGIFSKLSKLDTVLRDRDRVEIYRPLIADPKEVRKQRAEEGKRMKKGVGEGGG
ncbi:MAG TPA: RnfH family protein [Betaproteobacteria bacterium]|nr:RnfH family protein [Betaproteobacteria bacterium]